MDTVYVVMRVIKDDSSYDEFMGVAKTREGAQKIIDRWKQHKTKKYSEYDIVETELEE